MIQCKVCRASKAAVFCCPDEAALCLVCDQDVHNVNKLASKHQRLPLSTPTSQTPKCDICQGSVGHFLCVEDRCLLCRKCDAAVHSANSLASAHNRFLFTGVRVDATEKAPSSSSSSVKMHSRSCNKIEPSANPNNTPPLTGQCTKDLPVSSWDVPDIHSRKKPDRK